MHAMMCTLGMQAERDSLMAQHRLTLADVASLRDALSAEGSAAQQADSSARDLQTRLATVSKQLTIKVRPVHPVPHTTRGSSLFCTTTGSSSCSGCRCQPIGAPSLPVFMHRSLLRRTVP